MSALLVRSLLEAALWSARSPPIRQAATILATASLPSHAFIAGRTPSKISNKQPMFTLIRQNSSSAVAQDSVASQSEQISDIINPSLSPSESTFSLRPYQKECINDCLAALSSGITRIGVSSPTGSGKTTIFTHLLHLLPPHPVTSGTRVLIIVNSIELALQAANAVTTMFSGKSVEIEQGTKYKASGLADVTVATYQTLNRSEERLNKFRPQDFKAVVVDEAHHAAAPSYLKVLSHFDPLIGLSTEERGKNADVGSSNSVPVIGFSATFSRHDGLALGKVFDRIVFHKDFLTMIGEKWLCPIRFTSIKADIDLSSVKINNLSSDFATSSLASVVNTEVVNRIILKAWIDRAHTRRRSTLIFAVNIQHVQDLTATFRNAGVDARYLHGGTPMMQRRQLLEDFRNGVYPILVNCAILTEGADVPAIDCVVLARPTRSRNLFSQMIGRGLRLSPKTKKKDCLILDIVGNIEKGVVCTPTLFGLNSEDIIEDESAESLLERSQEDAATLDSSEAVEQQQTDPFEISLRDPTKITYIDYEDPVALQKAMLSRSTVVETMSMNAWVDCGGEMYILDVPRRGFVKVERNQLETDAEGEEKIWTSWFTPSNSDADEAAAAEAGGGRSSARFGTGKLAGGSPYRRPRHVLYSPTLEQAVRGSDLYVKKNVLKNSPQLFSTLNRRAPWRTTKASDSQRNLVEKRLGLFKQRDSTSGPFQVEKVQTERSAGQLTKGQASIILTRLLHGAKTRWKERVKKSNKLWRKSEKDKATIERGTVKVGPLIS